MPKQYALLPDCEISQMVIPVSKKSFFNTKSVRGNPPCAYDMLFHPPDYNPKAKRADRQDPQIIKNNIYDQEYHKPIPSTTHLTYGRPYWPIHDKANKQFVRIVVKNENPYMRIHHVLEWAVLLEEGKPSLCP